MRFSRRDFLKAAGTSAVVLTTVGGTSRAAVQTSGVSAPIEAEIGSFIINGTRYEAEYEARTTLWEVIAVKLGLTGTNRSCNRASFQHFRLTRSCIVTWFSGFPAMSKNEPHAKKCPIWRGIDLPISVRTAAMP